MGVQKPEEWGDTRLQGRQAEQERMGGPRTEARELTVAPVLCRMVARRCHPAIGAMAWSFTTPMAALWDIGAKTA